MKQDTQFPLDEFSFQYVRLDRSGRVIEQKDGRGALWNEKLAGGQSLQVVALPGGFFQMGSMSGQGYIDETPRHGVQVAPFFLGRRLVPAQWQAVMKKAPRARFSGDNCRSKYLLGRGAGVLQKIIQTKRACLPSAL